MAVGAFITVPLGPVPFTLQTMMLAIIVMVLSPIESIVAVAGYLVLGAIGLPLFAGAQGGVGVIVGPLGGFLVGYIIAAGVVAAARMVYSRISDARHTRRVMQTSSGSYDMDTPKYTAVKRGAKVQLVGNVIIALALNAILYTCGISWYCAMSGVNVVAAIAACMLPFVVPDIIKMVVAIGCASAVNAALGHAGNKASAFSG
jgi:biotin transport system substrate-specific component